MIAEVEAVFQRLTDTVEKIEVPKISYKNLIITEFIISDGTPTVLTLKGDFEGLTGYTIDEVKKGGLFQTLKIKPKPFLKVVRQIEENGWIVKENEITHKDGFVIPVRSLMIKKSPQIILEYTWPINQEL